MKLMTYLGYGPVEVIEERKDEGKAYLVVRLLAPSFRFVAQRESTGSVQMVPIGTELLLGAKLRQRLIPFELTDEERAALRRALDTPPAPATRRGNPNEQLAQAQAAVMSATSLANEIIALRTSGTRSSSGGAVMSALEEHARILLSLAESSSRS